MSEPPADAGTSVPPRGPRFVQPGPSRFAPRQQLVAAVVGVVLTATVILLAVSRTWLVQTKQRPAPAPPLVEKVSGASLVPLLPALALVALAGAGALVATRGRWRSVVAVVITMCGLGIVIVDRSPARTDGIASGWVLTVGLCGVGIALVGAFTLRNGSRWPTMGARYERPAPPPPAGAPPAGDTATPSDERSAGPDRAADTRSGGAHIGDTGWWDAIDRGEDPTKE
jgi:hypothetical protein